jgi:glycosyltransferase involved in cell wall biosynthesis
MKVAFYTPTGKGGHAKFSQCLLQGLRLARPQWELILCTSWDLGEEYVSDAYRIERLCEGIRPKQEFPTRLHWVADRLTHYYRRDAAFLRWAEQTRPEVVHLQEWFFPSAARFVSRLQRLGCRVVMSVHNLYRHEQHFPGHSRLQQFFEHRAWRQADRLVVMSPKLGAELAGRAKASPGRIAMVPHFVWPEGSEVPPAAIETKRARRMALLFGAIRRNKGIEDFIDACAEAGDVSGLIAGHCPDSGYAAALAERIERSGARVEFRNRFLGEGEIADLFAESSVAVFPYTSFGSQSGALFMAVAHETPAVGSEVGAIGDTIREGGLGEVVPARAPTELAAALRGVLRPERYIEAVAATRRLKEAQSIRSIGLQLAESYELVLTQAPCRPIFRTNP